MVDQPGAGGSHSYKIRGHSRQRHSAKPYSRPSVSKKGVLETVKDFFSPAWLVDIWKGKSSEQEVEDDLEIEDGVNDQPRTQDSPNRDYDFTEAPGTSANSDRSVGKVFGNGGVHTHGLPKGKNALSTFLTARSHVRTNIEYATIRESETESSYSRKSVVDGGLTRTDKITPKEVRFGQGVSDSEMTEEPSTSDGPAKRQQSLGISLLQADPSRPALPSSFFTSTPMPGIPRTSERSTPDTPLNLSRTPAQTPSTSLLQFGGAVNESRRKPESTLSNRPSFSVTAFGSPLPPRSQSRSNVHPYSSPFYSGKTSFGGASQTAGRKRMRVSSPKTTETTQPVRKQIRPTPVAASGGTASQTAKRILEALEKMSTPLIDAKKIPPSPPFSTSSSPLSFTQPQKRRVPPNTRPVGSPRKLQAQFGAPPVQPLSGPQRASISRVTPRTTPDKPTSSSTPVTMETEWPMESTAGLSSRSIMNRIGATKSTTSTSTSTLTSVSQTLPVFTPTPLPISLSPETSSTRVGRKIRRERTSGHYTLGRTRQEEEEDTETVNPLPEVTSAVPLQLQSGKSLPTFSFTASISSTTSKKTDTAPPSTATDMAKNNFKFSAPAPKIFNPSIPASKKTSPNTKAFSFSKPASVKPSENSTRSDDKKSSAPATNLLEAFRPPPGSWECGTCMIQNKADVTTCVACEASKPGSKPAPSATSSTSNGLFNKQAPPAGSWTCDTCLISNKEADSRCAACQSPKPTSSGATATAKMNINVDDNLRKKFAPPEGSWECDTCMVNNKGSDTKCVACETAKPGANSTASKTPAFGASSSTFPVLEKFAPPPGSWTCDTCMIVNKAEHLKCLACETPKPGAKPAETSGFKPSVNSFSNSPFKFGVDKSEPGSLPTVKFGVTTTADASSMPKFQFGSSGSKDTAVPSVKFGVSSESSDSKAAPGGTAITFGVTKSLEDKPKIGGATIKFGVSSETSDGKLKESPAPFKFGTESGSTSEGKTTVQFGSVSNSSEGSSKPLFGTAGGQLSSTPKSGFTFGGDSVSSSKPVTAFSSTNSSTASKPSIADAAALGFLKVPASTPPDTTPSASSPADTSSSSKPSIGDAAKAGFLKIPTAGDHAPPNVNLFASASNSLPGFTGLPKAEVPKETSTSTTATQPLPFAFGTGAATTTDDNSAIKPFTFGSTSALPSFPKVEGSKGSEAAKPAPFSFGAGVSSTAGTGVAPTGIPGNAAPTSSVAPFSFTGTSTTTAAATGIQAPAAAAPSTASKPFQFGSGAVSPFTFGTATGSSTSVPQSIATAPFVFGAATTTAEALTSTSTPFAFGAATTTAAISTSTSTPFAFGAPATAAAASTASSAPSAFVFGATPVVTSTPAATSGFSFTAAGSSSTVPKPGFGGFGNTAQPFAFGASSSVPEESMEADGNNNNNQGNGAAPPILAPTGPFGATPAIASAPSAPGTGGFAFGQPAAAPSTGFNFSSSTQQPSSSVFKFGAATPTAPAQFPMGGTPFAAPVAQQPTASAGGFSFTAPPAASNPPANPAPPAFGFTGATGSVGGFTGATGSVGGFTPGAGDSTNTGRRVIKRGVRRSRRGAQ
ncbi:nuclear pore complex protein Nup153 isoform X2 [Nematostella vectensis]|uniref:nuclear pore complex protein Nup153 isoform X2 n=1 Tax=Nematostella vectensis TaxID=45351 RepID=UPI0020771878|nr:nuclear pore complex protein Nup153 isoform X2 [Nematostella vectensis]